MPLKNAYEEMYCQHIRQAVKSRLALRGWTYEDLALALEKKFEFRVEPNNLKNRINRGNFPASVAAMMLAALGENQLFIPDLEGTRPTRVQR